MNTPSTQPPQDVQLVRSVNVPTIYVEGISQLAVGFPNSRLTLHSMVDRMLEGDVMKEKRTVACELVMPTASMIEFAQIILNSLHDTREDLTAVRAAWVGNIERLMNSVQRVETPTPEPLPIPPSVSH
jgi:hypothetical protein